MPGLEKAKRVSEAQGSPAESVATADAIAGTPKHVESPIETHGPSDVVVDFKAAAPDGVKQGKGKVGDDFGPVASGPAGKASGRPLLMSNEEAAPQATIAPLPGSQGPGRLTAPDSPYTQRSVEQHKPLIEKLGGTNESEAAVARALAYLAGSRNRTAGGLMSPTTRRRAGVPGRRMTWLTPRCRCWRFSPRTTRPPGRAHTAMWWGVALRF